MTGARWERVASIVERALELPPAEREAFVVRECAGDAALRAEVDALLATEPEAGFMEPPDVEAVLSGAETPGRRIAEFELIRPLGRGGFGTVHLARDTALGRLVAVKVLSAASSFSESDVARFRREARAAARLRHPGIVRVHRADEVDGVHFIAMEHVEGPTLAAALGERGGEGSVLRRDRNGLPAPAAVAELVAAVAEALHYAHGEGVVHRDVKPQNILLEGGSRPRLVDFGMAWDDTADSITRTGDLAGTYAYMSPEQAEMKRIAVDHRTDVFSLGAVLYRALTLELPFGGDTSREVLDRILTTDPRPPRRRNERVPRDLEVICLKALEKRPDDRYPSAGAFAEDLRRFLAHEAITARPPSVPERLWRWSRRHPVAASGALLLPAATALVVVLVGEVRDRERVSGWRERIEAALRHDDWNGREDVVADARRAAEEARGAGRGGGLEDVLGSFERRREEDVAARVAEIERLYRRGKGGEEIEGRFETLVTPLSLRAVLEGLDRAGRAATAYPDFPEIGALTRVDSELRIDAAPPSADRPPRERPVARALPLDPISGAFGPPVPLGPLPVRARLPPGGWRIVVEDPASDAFAEFDRDLGIEARRETIRVRLRPEADVTAGMVRLPAARLVLDQKLGCGPVHGEVDVPSFWIDEAEVSNREYLAFVEATDHAPPAFWVSAGYDGDWRALPGVAERGEEWLDLPATGMSLYDMRAYAEWAGKRLPGHYELEYAIRGVEMLTELPKGEPANIHGPSTGSVDGAVARYAQYVAHSMPVRASAYRQPPHGLFHVHGNVMERAWGKAAHVDRGNLLVLNNSFLVMGGAWDADVRNDRIFEHSTSGRDDAYAAPDYGFRCVIGGHSHD